MKRQMKLKNLRTPLIIIFAAVCVIGFVIGNNIINSETVQTEFLMNTVATIRVQGRGRSARNAVNAAFAEAREIERLTSYFDPSSEVSRINRAHGGERIEVSPRLWSILTLAREVSQASVDAFDVTVANLMNVWGFRDVQYPRIPGHDEIEAALWYTDYRQLVLHESGYVIKARDNIRIDLGSIAKGYAADRAAEILREHGIREGIVDFGGDIAVFGDRTFNVGLQRAFAPRGEYWRIVEARNTAVVTSGIYERYFEADDVIYHHIMDPRTGRPARNFNPDSAELFAVSVAGPSAALADALSTALFVIVTREQADYREFLDNFPGYSAYFEFRDSE